MANITPEITAFQSAVYGEEVRSSMISLANKLNTVCEDNVTEISNYKTSINNDLSSYKTSINNTVNQYKQDTDTVQADINQKLALVQQTQTRLDNEQIQCKTYKDDAFQSKNDAKASADAAKISETNAKSSETNAKTSENLSNAYCTETKNVKNEVIKLLSSYTFSVNPDDGCLYVDTQNDKAVFSIDYNTGELYWEVTA